MANWILTCIFIGKFFVAVLLCFVLFTVRLASPTDRDGGGCCKITTSVNINPFRKTMEGWRVANLSIFIVGK